MRSWKLRNAAIVILAAWPAVAMAVPSYTAVFLPGNGAQRTYATGIADNGQIVGWSTLGVSEGLIWSSPTSAPLGIVPPGVPGAQILSTDGTTQGGSVPLGGGNQAAIWKGTNDSFIDLSPSGYASASVNSVFDSQEVGVGITATTPTHALLWNGSDPDPIDLNPTGFQQSFAEGTNGTYQVGSGIYTPGSGQPDGSRALFWNGTASSAVDITPAGYSDAGVAAISGDRAVGVGSPGIGQTDALLWNIAAGTYTDLGPGTAFAVAGNYEAGYRGNDAMVWASSAASAVDLQNLLPSSYAYSVAYGVDSDGNIVGAAGSYGQWQAVVWMIPEPSAIAILPILALSFANRRGS